MRILSLVNEKELANSSFSLIEPFIIPRLTYPLPLSFTDEARKKIIEILRKALPPNLCFEDKKDFFSWLSDGLPFVRWINFETLPDCFSIFLICKPVRHISLEEIFLNHLKKWLSPEKKIPLLAFYHEFFHLEGISDSEFFIAEARLLVENQGLHYTLQSHLPSWSQELGFILKYPSYSSDLLNLKMSSYPQQPLPFFQLFVDLIQKYPNYIENDIFNDLRCLFALTTPEFRGQRSSQSLARIICSHYFLRKQLLRNMGIFPEKRHLLLRLLPSQLSSPFGSQTILGIALVVYLPAKYEYFDEQHILLSVQELFPKTQALKGSYYLSQTSYSAIRSLYLEIEKLDGKCFSINERKQLLKHLRGKLKERVEKLTPSIFMNRNEEETMKNIFFLSQELTERKDLPQVVISIEKQTLEHLFFTVTLVRILHDQDRPLGELFSELGKEAQFFPDRTQIVGYLSEKYSKEANVFQLRLERTSFLRPDSSTHFYLARQKVVTLLEKALGAIRDYYGGMILQQGEQLLQLKNVFPHVSAELLENFFYSITPIEMQGLLPLSLLTSLFQVVLGFIESPMFKKENFFSKTYQEKDYSLVILRGGNSQLKEILDRRLRPDHQANQTYAHFSVNFQETWLSGYICHSSDKENQELFASAIYDLIEEWKKKKKNLHTLRLNFQDWPYSLDPRLGGDTLSTILLKILYEGLTRKGKDGSLSLALAEKVSISEDLKTYIFKLREYYWSNGDKVVAYDFEYAWKKILSPHFSTPFAYLFYPIKNAKAVKEGLLPIDQAKISSLDPFTLSIELEAPSSYFLELLLHPLFSPVNHQVDQKYPYWCSQDDIKYVCNGPFYLRKADPRLGRYEIAKNPLYWDASEVDLDEIIVLRANSRIALEMFLNNEIDWLGRPTRPWELSFAQASDESIQTYYTPGVYWYVFNVQAYPFHNKNIRKAIAQAIDRRSLADLQYGAGTASITPLAYAHTQHLDKPIPSRNPELARKYFDQALKELGISHKEFPILTLIHTKGEVRDSIADLIERQIEEALGIRCKTENYSWEILFDKMTKGEYQIGAMGWTSIVDDPLYTLNAFKYKHEKINFAKWENSTYQDLLNAADREHDKQKRQKYLADAEAILIEELPLISLSYEVKQYMKKKHIQLPSSSYAGEVDFKWLTINTSEN
jgi:oligopeptide transport system substrate-binding protein